MRLARALLRPPRKPEPLAQLSDALHVILRAAFIRRPDIPFGDSEMFHQCAPIGVESARAGETEIEHGLFVSLHDSARRLHIPFLDRLPEPHRHLRREGNKEAEEGMRTVRLPDEVAPFLTAAEHSQPFAVSLLQLYIVFIAAILLHAYDRGNPDQSFNHLER